MCFFSKRNCIFSGEKYTKEAKLRSKGYLADGMGTEIKGAIAMAQYPQSPRCRLLAWAAPMHPHCWRLCVSPSAHIPSTVALNSSHYSNSNTKTFRAFARSQALLFSN